MKEVWLSADQAYDVLNMNRTEIAAHGLKGLWYARADGLDFRPYGPYMRDGREAWYYIAGVKLSTPPPREPR